MEHGTRGLVELAREASILIVCAPLNAETSSLINDEVRTPAPSSQGSKMLAGLSFRHLHADVHAGLSFRGQSESGV